MSIRDIRIQKLFLIALVLKVVASGLGWYLGSPWLLGLVVPLLIMGAYILLGINRRDSDVSDDKFADSAYYLGFIFTITSIIFSLFDLPNIGTRIQDIAVRFGAAMVSTVLGLGVRVYLVSFRADVSDAIRDAEDALLGATRTFTERLSMSLERLQDFESRVDLAARSTVERVNLQVEALSKNHADKLSEFFAELTKQHREGQTKALDEVGSATSRLSASVDLHAKGMSAHIESVEARVNAFASAVAARLESTTFPDDYFAKRLEAPLQQLELAAGEVTSKVSSTAEEISKSATVLSSSLQAVTKKAAKIEPAMDTVLGLAGQQQLVLQNAQGQLDILVQLGAKLEGFEALLAALSAQLRSGQETNTALADRVSNMLSESAGSRTEVMGALSNVALKLEGHATANQVLTERIGTAITTTERLVEQLGRSAALQADTPVQLATLAEIARKMDARADATPDAEKHVVDTLASLSEQVLRIESILREVGQSWQVVAGQAGPVATKLSALVDKASTPTQPPSSSPFGSITQDGASLEAGPQAAVGVSAQSLVPAPTQINNDGDTRVGSNTGEVSLQPVSDASAQQSDLSRGLNG